MPLRHLGVECKVKLAAAALQQGEQRGANWDHGSG